MNAKVAVLLLLAVVLLAFTPEEGEEAPRTHDLDF